MGEVYPNPVPYLPGVISLVCCALVPAEPEIVCESVGELYPAIPRRRFYTVWLRLNWRPSSPGNGSETGWCRDS
jgi:hypothetical protein